MLIKKLILVMGSGQQHKKILEIKQVVILFASYAPSSEWKIFQNKKKIQSWVTNDYVMSLTGD